MFDLNKLVEDWRNGTSQPREGHFRHQDVLFAREAGLPVLAELLTIERRLQNGDYEHNDGYAYDVGRLTDLALSEAAVRVRQAGCSEALPVAFSHRNVNVLEELVQAGEKLCVPPKFLDVATLDSWTYFGEPMALIVLTALNNHGHYDYCWALRLGGGEIVNRGELKPCVDAVLNALPNWRVLIHENELGAKVGPYRVAALLAREQWRIRQPSDAEIRVEFAGTCVFSTRDEESLAEMFRGS